MSPKYRANRFFLLKRLEHRLNVKLALLEHRPFVFHTHLDGVRQSKLELVRRALDKVNRLLGELKCKTT